MAQNRATSIFAKQEKIAQDLQQVQKTLALLLKEAIKMKKQYGNKAAISKNILEYSKICILLQKKPTGRWSDFKNTPTFRPVLGTFDVCPTPTSTDGALCREKVNGRKNL